MPNISVIVPVYNTEKYLHRCIDSILAQTFSDFELLLIDDGSKDNSGTICDEYAAKDSRVRVFHKENGGVSSARNMGLDNARGEWVTFVDSDDWVELDCLEVCFCAIQKHIGIDIIRYGYYREMGLDNRMYVSNCDILVSGSSKMLELSNKYCYWGFLWNTFFHKSIIGDIRFDEELCWCEDHIFTYNCMSKSKLMYILSKSLYHYRVTDSGLSRIIDPEMICRVAEKEFYLILPITNVSHASAAYYAKLRESINVLYKYEKSYCRRRLFNKSMKLVPEAIVKRDIIIDMYKSKFIPFFIKDMVLVMRTIIIGMHTRDNKI